MGELGGGLHPQTTWNDPSKPGPPQYPHRPSFFIFFHPHLHLCLHPSPIFIYFLSPPPSVPPHMDFLGIALGLYLTVDTRALGSLGESSSPFGLPTFGGVRPRRQKHRDTQMRTYSCGLILPLLGLRRLWTFFQFSWGFLPPGLIFNYPLLQTKHK